MKALNLSLPSYCTAEFSRHGRVCVYYRRVGQTGRIRIREQPLSPEFWHEYARLLSGASASPPARRSANNGPGHGTWRWLCVEYFQSAPFRKLAMSGQKVRRAMLSESWDEPLNPTSTIKFADFPLDRFIAKPIRVLRDRKTRWEQRPTNDGVMQQVQINIEAANSRLKYIRGVLAWALEAHDDLVTRNWAKDVPYLKSGSEGWHTWTLDELAAFENHHPVGSKARLVMALALYGGQRRGDIARMGRVQERDGMLQVLQEKNRRMNPITAWVPIVPPLRAVIDASQTGDLFYVVQSNGRPYGKESLGNLFRTWCKDAGLPHCSLHGLRKACVVRMIMDGCTPHEVMAVTGHRTLKEIDRYAREFLRETAADSVHDKWLVKYGGASA